MNFNPEAAAKSYLKSHQTGGKGWPVDAQFAAKYNMHTWPCGWQKEASVEFFSSLQELEEWKAHKNDWALCEDNHVAYTIYEWDLGPNLRADLSYGTNDVGRTYEEIRQS